MAITLKNQDVIDLYNRGVHAWNNWVERHRFDNILVEDMDFPGKDCEPGVSFLGFNFPEGTLVFRRVRFNSNSVTFAGCRLRCSRLEISSIKQEILNLNFSGAQFSCKSIRIDRCNLGSLRFAEANLGCGSIYIGQSNLRGGINFDHATKESGRLFITLESASLSPISFSGFETMSTTQFYVKEGSVTSFDCRFAKFNGALDIKGELACVPDLRNMKADYHVDLSGLTVKLSRAPRINKPILKLLFKKAEYKSDSERLCRLKEIAESNKNHKRALAFHADEQRASRWGVLNPWQSVLDMLYSVTSNYGQSIARPLFYLALSIIMFATYSLKQPENIHKDEGQFKTAITVSIATVTPFISISKTEREAGIAKLYGDSPPEDYGLYSYAHAGISFVFIFLIGLGLRNRFRI